MFYHCVLYHTAVLRTFYSMNSFKGKVKNIISGHSVWPSCSVFLHEIFLSIIRLSLICHVLAPPKLFTTSYNSMYAKIIGSLDAVQYLLVNRRKLLARDSSGRWIFKFLHKSFHVTANIIKQHAVFASIV